MVGERVRSLSSVVRLCDSDGVGRGRYSNAHTPIPLFYNPHHASRCRSAFCVFRSGSTKAARARMTNSDSFERGGGVHGRGASSTVLHGRLERVTGVEKTEDFVRGDDIKMAECTVRGR